MLGGATLQCLGVCLLVAIMHSLIAQSNDELMDSFDAFAGQAVVHPMTFNVLYQNPFCRQSISPRLEVSVLGAGALQAWTLCQRSEAMPGVAFAH